MKTIKSLSHYVTLSLVVAAFALTAGAKDQYDIRPEESADKAPTAAEWQDVKENAAALEAAIGGLGQTALPAAVASEEAAMKLLAEVKGAYKTDVITATKIAAVTQYVMTLEGGAWWEFWKDSVPAERIIWVKALIKTAKEAKDPYIAVFCFDQLRWCGCAKCAESIVSAAEGKEQWVKDFAAMTAKELKTR